MAKSKKPAKKAPKKAPVKKAKAKKPATTVTGTRTTLATETFAVHSLERTTTEAGNRRFEKVPRGTFTVDLSNLTEEQKAAVRNHLKEL